MSRAVVDAKEFSHAMSKISKVLKKCAIPILEEVCLQIQNGRCTLTATDLETWLTAEFPASGDDMFFAFRKTKDILRACSHFAGELTMEFSETQSGSKKAGRVLLRCERRGAEFEVYDGADYPNMPQAPEGDAFSVSSARLSACVERVRYAAEKPSVSARPAAICVQFCGNRVYALDGTRLACDTLEGVSFPKPFLVRADVLAHLSAFGKEDMTVRIGSSHVLFASGNLRMLARLQGVDTYNVDIPKADGYLQVALCLNARMEDLLNATDTKMNGTLPFSSQLADAVREAVRDYHEGSMYKRDEAVRTFRRNLFPRWKPNLGNVLACCDIFQIILEVAYEKYVSAANQNNQNYQEIARLGYVSKAYLVLAAIGTSGGALNLLAQMLINQANQYEADQRIPFFRRHPDIGTFVQQHAAPYGWPLNDNYALAYRVLQIVCGIQRGSQPYSHMKKAELVLKGYVSESSSTQLTSLNIAINGGLAMGHYWKGRLLLEQAKQDHDRCNDYKDAAIASFCATNVTERFDHLPENADEDAAPQLSPPQWLSAIELLRYPDREVFRVDRRMVFQTIYQKLTQQVEEVQSDRIQIHNERYRLTKKDVRSNLERCLDMVKARFPDKEPLIQEMIRSIR